MKVSKWLAFNPTKRFKKDACKSHIPVFLYFNVKLLVDVK